MELKVISQIELTKKGKEKIEWLGYYFRCDKVSQDKHYWSCVMKEKSLITV